ncbi:MAG: hypothetical protein ABSG46_01155 [Candidatus Binataceae bacterium]|jgi:hypothetical protein
MKCARFATAVIVAGLAIVLETTLAARAFEVKRAGTLNIPLATPMIVFSTDPTIMNTLTQDIEAARRGADANTQAPLTLTVNVAESPLKPGVMLNSIAMGDPDVASLIKAAGATPPPLGDTGDEVDQAALAQARAQSSIGLPHDTPMQSALSAIQSHGELGPMADAGGCNGVPCPDPNAMATPHANPGDPGYTGDVEDYVAQSQRRPHFFQGNDNSQYQTVVVARAGVSGSPQEMTVVAVVNPGEDVREAKRMVAEEIANSVLR